MTIEHVITVVTSAGAPGVLALWLWSERKERLRLQRMLESFLPVMEDTRRVMRGVSRVVGGNNGEDDA